MQLVEISETHPQGEKPTHSVGAVLKAASPCSYRQLHEASLCQGSNGTSQGPKEGLATVTTEPIKKKIREEVDTGHCVPMAGRSEIYCALL